MGSLGGSPHCVRDPTHLLCDFLGYRSSSSSRCVNRLLAAIMANFMDHILYTVGLEHSLYPSHRIGLTEIYDYLFLFIFFLSIVLIVDSRICCPTFGQQKCPAHVPLYFFLKRTIGMFIKKKRRYWGIGLSLVDRTVANTHAC